MRVSITGVPEDCIAQARALIQAVFATVAGASALTISAHRLSSGEWLLMAFDGADLQSLRGELADQLVRALSNLSVRP